MADADAVSELLGAMAEPSRARMMLALMAGQALTAGELASAATISRQTASSHLELLVAQGLLTRRSQGRHRYFQLADAAVAETLENVLALSGKPRAAAVSRALPAPGLCRARVCYDHLAGDLAVAIFDAMWRQEMLVTPVAGPLLLTPRGESRMTALGLLVPGETPATGRPLARACLDWTARRSHLSGLLGQRLLGKLLDSGCLRRVSGSRELLVSIDAERQLREWGLLEP